MQNDLVTLMSPDFSFLDQPEFAERYTQPGDPNRMCFYIGGIKCAKCVRKLESLPAKISGLRELRVDMGRNLAYASISPGHLRFSELAGQLREQGFTPVPVRNTEDALENRRTEDRRDLRRLGVAGLCAANIMMFSVATYLGDTGEFFRLFSWSAFLLYLPVVTYVAWPFYTGAWDSLRRHRLSIDLPMAAASLAGFIFSTLQLLRGNTDIYYDSLSGFLFLILIARWFQKKMQRSLTETPADHGFGLQKARVLLAPGWKWAPVDTLAPGHEILLRFGETLPADAELSGTSARFGLAWLTGEQKPRTFLAGAVVPAGARLYSDEAALRVVRNLAYTGFGQILDQARSFSLSRNRLIGAADRWAQWLLVTVFTVALVFLAVYWSVSPSEAVRRSLALVVLACPCAMAFGTPLALYSAMRKALRNGVVIRHADVLEKIPRVRTIFFDKTGTLTDTDLSLKPSPEFIAEDHRRIILSLENRSLHPMAFAFRQAFSPPGSSPPDLPSVSRFTETAGTGVSGLINHTFYELKRLPGGAETAACGLFENGRLLHRFFFEARCKADAPDTLNALRSRGLRLFLLSGDQSEAVNALAEQLGFRPEEVYSGLSPEGKAQLVAATPGCMMVGDGINDSPALLEAAVGVAVSGGVETALRSADIYLSADGLGGLIPLLQAGRDATALIRQNLLISAVYNTAGGTLALLGYINPVVAAVLMPLSSGFILFSTWLRSRS